MVKNIKFPNEVKLMSYEEVEKQFEAHIIQTSWKYYKMLKMEQEDLYQDLRIVAYECYLEYDISKNVCFSTVLFNFIKYRICRIAKINKRKLPTISLNYDDTNQLSFIDHKFQNNLFNKCLLNEFIDEVNKLDEYSKVVVLMRLQGYLDREIGRLFNRKANTIWTRYQYAIKTVLKNLGEVS